MKKFAAILAGLLFCITGVPAIAAVEASARIEAVADKASAEETATLYGIGSVSKVFTAAAAMKLVEEGKLDLDQPLTTYIPEFTMADDRYTDITPRMLLNHSAGLMGMTANNAELLGDNDTYNHDHFLVYLSTQTLKHDPGETSIYCNDSFTLAEILIERVSGMSFTEYIARSFLQEMRLQNIKTPQSDFDRERLAPIYVGSSEMQSENFGVIGSGGIYTSMEDLCRYATLFMDGSDGQVLSLESAAEMARDQHQNPVVGADTDSTIRYGLGWDGVNTYPFNQYGIQALSKGGGTGKYHSNLTVLPEYDLAVAVASSGEDSYEQLISQEILLEILREEGLIDDEALTLPVLNDEPAMIPEYVKSYAGLYDMGQGYFISAEFTDDTLILTPIGVRNERAQEYLYNTEGKFVSTNGDYISLGALATTQDGTRGVTELEFLEDKYMVMQSYEMSPGLSQTAYAIPVAEKVEPGTASADAIAVWQARNDKEYLLVSEKYSSYQYVNAGVAKVHTDERASGYVGVGIYEGSGKNIKSARISDSRLAVPYQSTPTMFGRDTNYLSIETESGVEALFINDYRYIDASSIENVDQIGESVCIGAGGAVWFDLTEQSGGQSWGIGVPENGSWFIYDEKMNYVASSLEKNVRATVTLPKSGRIVFVGESGEVFAISK